MFSDYLATATSKEELCEVIAWLEQWDEITIKIFPHQTLDHDPLKEVSWIVELNVEAEGESGLTISSSNILEAVKSGMKHKKFWRR